MTIYIPSYHKENRKISPLLNRKESIFIIRPSQKDWYTQNFPNAVIMDVIDDNAPTGINGVKIARQWALDDWRNNNSNEEFAWMLDDDWKGFTLNNGKGKKRTHPTLDETFNFLLSLADAKTRIIGPTNSNSEMAFNSEVIRTNKGEAPESAFLFSKKCVGNYIDNTFENQYLAGLQYISDFNFKVVQALELNYYNDQRISTIFYEEDYIKLTQDLCNNTIKDWPKDMYEIKVGKQGTYKIKFREKLTKGFMIS